MRNYWNRLKDHPGVPHAFFLSALFIAAGFRSKSEYGWIAGLIISALTWSIVLITAYKK